MKNKNTLIYGQEKQTDAVPQESPQQQMVDHNKRAKEELRREEHSFRALAEQSSDIIILVNKEGIITYANPAIERALGFKAEERIGAGGFERIHPDDLNYITDVFNILVRDTNAPVQRSEMRLRHKDGSWHTFEAVASNLVNNDVVEAVIVNYRDIAGRKKEEAERIENYNRIKKTLQATVQSIALIVETKDPYTAGHQQRVSHLAQAIASEMNFAEDRQDFVHTAAIIHDLGKVSVPSEIFSKQTKLSELEFNLIKIHSQSGYNILKDIEFPWPVADVVLQHHERMDGSGYPQHLQGEAILLESRIVAVADVVEAMSSRRPYRPALEISFALDEISRNKGILYDASVVDACLKLFQEKKYNFTVHKNVLQCAPW
jgi:PAS domain S-box-containing protein/putative nucleotidyltransferase with HDIG domain